MTLQEAVDKLVAHGFEAGATKSEIMIMGGKGLDDKGCYAKSFIIDHRSAKPEVSERWVAIYDNVHKGTGIGVEIHCKTLEEAVDDVINSPFMREEE